jgi:hypothetical protein
MMAVAGLVLALMLGLGWCSTVAIGGTTLQSSTEFLLSGKSTAEKFDTLRAVCRGRGVDAYCLGDPYAGMELSYLYAGFLTSNLAHLALVRIGYLAEAGETDLVVGLHREKDFDLQEQGLGHAKVAKSIPSVGGLEVIYQVGDRPTAHVLVAPRGETVIVVRSSIETAPGKGPGVDELADAQAHLVPLGQ